MGKGQAKKRSERDKLIQYFNEHTCSLVMDANEAKNHPHVAEKLAVHVLPLKSGDWAMLCNTILVGVERKSGADLVSSWMKKRLARQVRRMLSIYDVSVLLIEGMPNITPAGQIWTPYSGTLKRTEMGLWSDIVSLQESGMAVWYSSNLNMTPLHILRIQQYYTKHADYAKQAQVVTVPDGPERRLIGFDWLGPERARRLLAHFGSIRALATASVADVMTVPGFGKRLATEVVAQFEEEYNDK